VLSTDDGSESQIQRAARIILVDDSETFLRAATGFLVRRAPWLGVAGSFCTAAEAIERSPDLQPDVILLDLVMPGISGLEAIPGFREVVPEAAIVVLTMYDSESYRQAALEAGAQEFVSKSEMVGELLPAIRRVVDGRRATEDLVPDRLPGPSLVSSPAEAVA